MAAEQAYDNGGTELGRFLRARRSQVTPADVGFAPGTGCAAPRARAGRKSQALAGVSIDYYTRLRAVRKPAQARPSPAPAP